MTEDTRKGLRATIAVALLVGLFPPWQEFTVHRGIYLERPAGHHFLFSAPKPVQLQSVEVDRGRLFLQWGLVGAALLIWLLVRSQSKSEGARTITQRAEQPALRTATAAQLASSQSAVYSGVASEENQRRLM
jgi:hypothetical protein